MNASAVGALIGLVVGLAIVLLASWVAARRPPSLVRRIGPYLGAGEQAFRGRPDGLAVVVRALRRPTGGQAASSGRDLAARLEHSGMGGPVAHYRLERVRWAALGAASGLCMGTLLAAGRSSPLGVGLMALLGGAAGWWLRDFVLGRAIRRRRAAMERQLPSLVDLAALAVAAGATPIAAIESAAATMSGPLPEEVSRAGDDIRAGSPGDAALRAMAARTGLVSVQRFVDGILIALERGTPLVEVMRAQAEDVRAVEGRRLMELAGRKDVAMLVPIVFLVLPSVVLIAVYPGIHALRLVVP